MDVKEVKEELKQDEELLVKVFKLEKFLKKYKKPLIIGISAIAILFIGYQIYGYMKEQQIIKENEALNRLLANPNDKEALKIVKENPNLYSLYLLREGRLKEINSKYLESIKAYELAMKKGDIKSLENYLLNPNYKILKNMVRLALIRLYLERNERDKAINIYKDIDENTKFKELAKYLIHYGIVK